MKNLTKLFLSFCFFMVCFFSQNVNAQLVINATGPANAFIVTYPANISTLTNGLSLTFFSNQSISGAATLNLNGTGPRSIVKNGNQTLAAGEIKSGQAVSVIFDGVNWQMTSSLSPSTSTGFWSTLGNTSDSTANYIGTNNNQPLIMSTNGTERMRISRAGRFGFNMNPTAGSMFNIKSLGSGAILSVVRSTDAGALIDLTETVGGNARIDMYNAALGNVVQIPSGPGNIFFAGGGNLGINTTAPGNNLHVLGGARITNLSISGPVFSNTLGDLFVSTATSNFWTVVGANLQPLDNTLNVNLQTSFGGYYVNGNRIVSSNSANVVFLGNAGSALNAGGNNLFYGVLSGSNNTTGNSNIFLGFQSGFTNITGTQNVYIGESTGLNAIGSNNIFLGQNAGRNTTSAFNNIFLGSSAGANNITGGTNIAIGAFADMASTNLLNAIAIGALATVRGNSMMALGGEGANAIKVGIGTGLPQNDLHVVGGARITNLSTSGAVFANSSGDLFVSASSGASAWTISGSNIFPQTLSNNVGIGTTAPGKNVGATRYLTVSSADVNPPTTQSIASVEIQGIAGGLNGVASRLDFNQSVPVNLQRNSARIALISGRSTQDHGQLAFSTYNGAMNEVMRVNTNGSVGIGYNFSSLNPPLNGLIVQGNVGFGTTAPGNNLDVVGGVRVSSLASVGPVFATALGDLYVNSTTGISGAGTTGGVAFWNTNNTLTADGANFLWDPLNKRLGIRTNAPGAPLDVQGGASWTGNLANFTGATPGGGNGVVVNISSSGGGTAIVANATGGAGNRIGISAYSSGSTGPAYGGYFNSSSSGSTTYGVYSEATGSGLNYGVYTTATGVNGIGVFSSAAYAGVFMNGRVGIGITTPSALLHLKGLGTTTATNAFFIQNAVNTVLFNIQDNGFVGIGNANPSERLEVNGNIQIPATSTYQYATPKTNFVSVAAGVFVSNFETGYSLFKIASAGATQYTYLSGGTNSILGYASAPVQLPHGATVTSFTTYLYKNATLPNPTMSLVRVSLAATPLIDVMGIVTKTTNGAAAASFTNSTISFSVIDNAAYTYLLVFGTSENSTQSRLYGGVSITYSVDKTD